MNRNHLVSVFVTAAERRAHMHGVRLGPGADGDIRQFARAAAERITDEHRRLQGFNDPVVTAAATAFEQLIDEMVLAATEIPGYQDDHSDVIGEDTLRRALSRLCPLFPIC